MTAVKLETPDLFTIEENNPIWTVAPECLVQSIRGIVKGTFFRVEAPESVDDAYVESLRKALLEVGASAVRVMPRRKRSVVPQAAVSESSPLKTRAVVMAMVERANTKNRKVLCIVVEESLAASGL